MNPGTTMIYYDRTRVPTYPTVPPLGQVEKKDPPNYLTKDYYSYRESIVNIQAIRQIGDIRRNFEMSQKQAEVDLLHQKQDNQRIIFLASMGALILIGMLALGLFHRNYYIRKTSHIIKKERDRLPGPW